MSKIYNFSHFFGPYNPFEKWAFFELDPLVWELILEQIANGTLPTSVNANIVSTVWHFSPLTIIKEQPSIWTIRQGRTMLLVVVETLAVYRLAKAKQWGQMHTNGSGR